MRDLFDLHKPALEAIGRKIFHMGPIGSAAVIKVITNMLAFIHLVADGEALMLAKRGGLDLGQAWAGDHRLRGTCFVHETEGQLILNGSYDIAFTMDLALKDLGFAMNFGREFGVPLDLAGLTNQTFMKGKAAYGGAAQSTQIAKLLEDRRSTPTCARPASPRGWNSPPQRTRPRRWGTSRGLSVQLALCPWTWGSIRRGEAASAAFTHVPP